MTKTPNKKPRVPNEDTLFLAWLDLVNTEVENEFGLSIHDLPDRNHRAAFEQGLSAKDYCDYELIPEIEDDM